MGRAIGAVLFVVIGFVAGWSVWRVFGDTDAPIEVRDHTFVAVVPGEVSSTRSLRATAMWTVAPAASNRAAGTVTSVELSLGDFADVGDVMYTVDESPVVAAAGDTPAYRDMKLGDRGNDIAQLQSMLSELGFYSGEIDGEFDSSLRNVVRAWQRTMGTPVTGVVSVGDVVFLPVMPSRVVLDADSLKPGQILSGGEAAIGVLGESPEFSVDIGSAQTDPVPVGQELTLVANLGGQEVSWSAVAGETVLGPDGLVVTLLPSGSAPICGDRCELVPIETGAALEAVLILVPRTRGLVVPIGALATTANGDTAVIDESGNLLHVEVVATARGMAVVEGVPEGTRVRVPARS